MDVQARIKQLCNQHDITLYKLATKAGLSETTIYDWFNDNKRMPSIRAIEDICSVFGISLAQFFTDAETDELDELEVQALEHFRQIPDKKKQTALAMLKAFTD